MKKIRMGLCGLLTLLLVACDQPANMVRIIDEVNAPATEFACRDLRSALKEAGLEVVNQGQDLTIRIAPEAGLQEQEYRISRSADTLLVRCGNGIGGMYGILDVAEQLALKGDIRLVEEKEASPFVEYRGIKMNIALDGRLPSYDDTGDASQKNIAEMWNMYFWVEFLDGLARHRYNLISFWSKHPFPAMIKMEEYPGAEMEDVYVFDEPITWEQQRDWRDVDPTDLSRFRKIRSMTIDEKIAFWQQVM